MPAIGPDETSLCPRCESTFECGILSGSCWCADANLTDAVRANLVKFYKGCLCPDCLKVLADTPAPPSGWTVLKGQLGLIRAHRRGGRSGGATENTAPAAAEAERILSEAQRMVVRPNEKPASGNTQPVTSQDEQAVAPEGKTKPT